MKDAEKVINFIKEELLFDPDVELSIDTPLFTSQLLDSMNLAMLLVFIEDTFGVRINAMEIVYDNFDSVEKILACVNRN